MGLWNMSEVQCTGAPVMDAPLPPVCRYPRHHCNRPIILSYPGLVGGAETSVCCVGVVVVVNSGATQPSSGRSAVWVSVVDFVAAGASPLVLAVVHEAPDVTGKG